MIRSDLDMTLELGGAAAVGVPALHRPLFRAGSVSLALHSVVLLMVAIGWAHRRPEGATISNVRPAASLMWLGRAGTPGDAERSAERHSAPVRRAARVRSNAADRAVERPAPPALREPVLTYVVPTLQEATELRSLPGVATPVTAFAIGSVDGGTGTDTGDGRPNGRGGQGNSGRGGVGGDGGGPYSGSEITQPALVVQVPPGYTADALHARAQGTVTVEATVRTDGSVGDVHIIRSFDPPFGLDAEAVRTVQKWRFNPGTRRGRPVPMLVTIELTFGLR
jgi:TonB family protein